MTHKNLISVVLILTILLHLPSRAGAEALDPSQYTNACSRPLGFGHINGIFTSRGDGEKQFKTYILVAAKSQNPKGLVVHPEFLYNQTRGLSDVIELLMQKSAKSGEAFATRFETIWIENGGKSDSGKAIDTLTKAWYGIKKIVKTLGAMFSFFVTNVFSWLVAILTPTPSTKETYTSIHDSLETFVKARDKILISFHSQGSFFANEAFKYLTTDRKGEKYSADRDLRLVYAAPVSEALQGSDNYTLADLDLAVLASRIASASVGNSSYPPNVHIPFYSDRDPGVNGKTDIMGHGMEEIYLNESLDTRPRWLANYKKALTALVGDLDNSPKYRQIIFAHQISVAGIVSKLHLRRCRSSAMASNECDMRAKLMPYKVCPGKILRPAVGQFFHIKVQIGGIVADKKYRGRRVW